MNYDNLVREGKTLIIKLEGAEVVVGKHRLTLGRLALEACGPPQENKGGRPSKTLAATRVTVRQFADDLGTNYDTLTAYRKVAHQWAAVSEAEQYSWAVLTLIADADDKETILANTVERFGRITVDTLREYTGRRTSHDAKLEQARADAKAEAEIVAAIAAEKAAEKAAAALAKALEVQAKADATKAEKAKQAALEKQKKEVEAKHKAVEEQTRAKAEMRIKEIEVRIRKELADAPVTLTPDVLAKMALEAFTSDDPMIVEKMAAAYTEHNAKRLAEEAKNKRAQEAENKRKKLLRDAENMAKRESMDYDDSALKLFNDAYDMAYQAHVLLSRKPITHANRVVSGLTIGEYYSRCESFTNLAHEFEDAIKNADAEGLIEEAMSDVIVDN